MKYHLIYFLDHIDDNKVIIKDYYTSKDDALNALEKIAIDFIKEQQGKQQTSICKQYDKSIEDIQKDTSIKEGLYLKKHNDSIVLYEKKNILTPGTIWNSFNLQVYKIGTFYTTDINIELTASMCSCNVASQKTTVKQKNEIVYTFLDEFKTLLSTNSIKLKPILKI